MANMDTMMDDHHLFSKMLGVVPDQTSLADLLCPLNLQDNPHHYPDLTLGGNTNLIHFTQDDFLEPTPINELNSSHQTASSSAAASNFRAGPADELQLLLQVLAQANGATNTEKNFPLHDDSSALPPNSAMINTPLRAPTGGFNNSSPMRTPERTANSSVPRDAIKSASTITPAITSTTAKTAIDEPVVVQYGRWYDRYQDLVEFKEKYGHCFVPSHWPRNPPLAQWIKRQRHQFKRFREGKSSTITSARVDALNKMKFAWDPHSAFWEERLDELYCFRENFGHCNVPTKFPDNPQLAVWAKCQRRQFKLLRTHGPKRSNMTVDRISKLSRVGFVFNPRQVNKRR